MAEKEKDISPRTFPTSVDVARKAGVSRATVYYALNDENGIRNGHVSEKNRAKVLQAAAELGYTPHGPARTLRKGQSDEICIITSTPPTIYRNELFVSAQMQALLHGYSPVSYFCHALSSERIEDLLMKIFARRPMGIFATGSSMDERQVLQARRMGIQNIVLYSEMPLPYAHTITFPIQSASQLATRHLLEQGHRRLALVHPDAPDLQVSFTMRLEGMRTVLAEVPDAALEIVPLDYSLESAYALIDTHLSKKERPTGIYALNDEYAILLIGALLDRGIRVPQDIAVIGTDNIALGELVRPSLTTIRFDALSIGQWGIETLIALHKDPSLPIELSRPMEPQLILRNSTRSCREGR